MSRARDLGSLINSNLPGKNLVINGGFDFWQRGTTWTGTGYSAADRWYAVLSGSVTVTQESSDLPSVGQIRYGAKWTTTANASYGQLYQAFEESLVRTIRGKVVTVSGYVKISGTYSGSQYLNTDYNTSSDALISQSTSNTSTPIGNAVDAANWKYFSIPIIVPANAVGFRIGFIPDQAQPSGAIVRLAAIQMEIGSATAFSRAGSDIQGELAKCQRYLQSYGGNTVYERFSAGFTPATTSAYFVRSPLVPMRVTPSISYSSLSDWNVELPGVAGVVPTALDVTWSGTSVQELVVTFASNGNYGGNKGCLFRANNTTNARLYYSAEL